MHGEYKTPGGKLVVADFTVVEGQLRAVEISGDFFLYPDEALYTIVQALEGAPSTAQAVGFAERVRAALDAEVTMLGFSPEAIGMAIQRGLEAG